MLSTTANQRLLAEVKATKGKTEAEATALAFDKIARVRKMAKTLTFKF
jgi:hypothetical protein